MNIEFKSIKTLASLSEETACYTAKLYIDGKYVADVSNHGHGGCDDYSFKAGFSYDTIKAADAWLAANTPKLDGCDFTTSVEIMGQEAANAAIDLANFRSKLSRSILIVKDGGVYGIKAKKTPAAIEACVARYGADNVLNTMSTDAAFKLFMKLTAA